MIMNNISEQRQVIVVCIKYTTLSHFQTRSPAIAEKDDHAVYNILINHRLDNKTLRVHSKVNKMVTL